ncbi:MAG: hypothetical protein GY714_08260 [Desulfobacterales bacterium]|nr:hypothetical protein [Desulfobacterales bacterium]MCP4162651.1 hypothetical protein [Deltaproteobacteria bacterium]
MGKRKKKQVIKGEVTPTIRKPIAPPGFSFKDKKKYDRKDKFKKGWEERNKKDHSIAIGDNSSNPFLFCIDTDACKIPPFSVLQ